MSSALDQLSNSGIDDLLPGGLAQGLQQLGVQNVTTTHHGDTTIIRGVVQSLASRGVLPAVGSLPLEAPGLTSGLRFQLAYTKTAGGDVTEWALDLDLDRISLLVPGLRPAKELHRPAQATVLTDDPSKHEVRIVGRGVLRIGRASGSSAVEVRLVDRLDDQNPFGPHGALASLTFAPPSFFLGGSSFGMTVDEITYDDSTNVSPGNKPPEWRGIAIRRATLFLPPGAPLLGDISLGVYDVFLGDPVGVEGIAFLEFGGAADTPVAVTFEQQQSGSWQGLAPAAVADGSTRPDQYTVPLLGAVPPAAHVRGTVSNPGGTVHWVLPHGASDPSDFTVLPGDVVEVRIDDAAPTRYTFTGTWAAGPTVSVTVQSTSWDAVTSVTGGATGLATATFAHGAGSGTYTWQWDDRDPQTGDTTHVPGAPDVGTYQLTLRDGDHIVRRIRVEVRLDSPLLVGCLTGVFTRAADGTSTPVPVVDVLGTYGLTTWIATGDLTRGQPDAAADSGTVTVGQGLLAEVSTALTVSGGGTSGTSGAVANRDTQAHVQFIFDRHDRNPQTLAWVGDAQVSDAELQTWLTTTLPAGTKIAIVGRCDDLSRQADRHALQDPDRNTQLANDRAQVTRNLLVGLGVADSDIVFRGEQTAAWTGTPGDLTGLPSEVTAPEWIARTRHPEYLGWRDSDAAQDDPPRPGLRRGDIYAYAIPLGSTPQTTDQSDAHDPTRVRALVPGADPSAVTTSLTPTSPRSRPQFRVRIEVEWHDLTAPDLAHATPMRAEAIVQWPGTQVQLPGGDHGDLSVPGSATTTTPVWTLRGRWAHDQASGSDDFTLSFDVAGRPDGIVAISSPVLAASMGLAPAVIGAAGHDPTGEDAVLVGALIGLLGALGSALLDNGRTVVTGITIDHLRRHDSGDTSRTLLTVDYTVELAVNVSNAGLPLQVSTRAGHPMKLHYTGVGVEVDTSKEHWWDGVGLHATGMTPTVVDPGSWSLGPPLDDLLRITGVNTGASSSWIEVGLALALDLGVVTLDSATVRITFGSDGIEGVELRGLRASVDIPGVLKGSGAVDVSAHMISAAVALEILPVHVAAVAALALGDGGFVSLMVGVRFPAAIPFANSGLGLYGLVGRFVTNGARNVDHANPDVLGREFTWMALAPQDKYGPHPGEYALGLGAIIGTVPDLGATFNALGMITVEFPQPEVVFAIVARVLSGELQEPSDQVVRPAAGLSIIGLVVVNEDSVTIAVQGHYEIPHVLILDIPIGAYFPLAQPDHSWFHLGTDNQPGREGSPVTLTLLPDVLDVRVWAFTMIHGAGLDPGLMGRDDFVFSGFAIGFGAGWDINWSAGPIRLSASAMVLAGFGTRPFYLAAGVWVRGELDLVILTISARGEIELKTNGSQTRLHGEFCGSVDCFFFSIEGCVSIDVTGSPAPMADPDSPVVGADLVGRRGFATARAQGDGVPELPTVWPDAVPVLHFAHTVQNGVSGGDFAIGTPMPGPVWSGSRDVQYAFRLDAVLLEPQSGPPLTPPTPSGFATAWWWPAVRSSEPPPLLSAGGSEARDLALLTWEPWLGQLPLTDPDDAPGGGAGGLTGSLCDPVDIAETVCAVGERGRPAGVGAALLPADGNPTSLRLAQPVGRTWSELLALASAAGVAVLPAGVGPLAIPTPLATGGVRFSGWRLAALARGGQPLGSLGASGVFDPALEGVTLLLELCPVPRRTKADPPVLPDGCVDLRALNANSLGALATDSGTTLRYDELLFAGENGERLELIDANGDGQTELQVPDSGLRIELPAPVDAVRLVVSSAADWKAVAADRSGKEIAAGGAASGTDELELRGEGISVVRLYAAERAGLAEVCLPDHDPYGELRDLFEYDLRRERFAPPAVVGIRTDGSEAPWRASTDWLSRCTPVKYGAPDQGPWAGLRIADAPGLTVSVVGACGVRWDQVLVERQAEQHRQEIVTAFGQFATGAAGAVRGTSVAGGGLLGGLSFPVVLGPPARTLLRPDTEYRLTVKWSWQRWQRSDSSPSPADPTAAAFTAGTDTVFRFRTAAETGLPTPPPPVDLTGEAEFEPRQVARFVSGAQPSGGLPHLLDDPIRVFLTIDYLATLLDGYGFEPRVEVRSTDVVPGSLTPEHPHPVDITEVLTQLAWRDDAVLTATEVAVAVASDDAPCLPPTSGPGTAIDVQAPLDPQTGYDLRLVAHPTSGSGADVVVSRWHFRTSRYRDVDAVLAALGLAPGSGAVYTPPDVVLTAEPSLPPAAPYDDATLLQALAAAGLDPWPLSPDPRTTLLWLPPDGGTQWRLVGALLEAPEPICRPGRVDVSGVAAGAALTHVASTATGTRVLLAAPTPTGVGVDDVVTVTLVDHLRSRTAQGSVPLLGMPRSIRAEVTA